MKPVILLLFSLLMQKKGRCRKQNYTDLKKLIAIQIYNPVRSTGLSKTGTDFKYAHMASIS